MTFVLFDKEERRLIYSHVVVTWLVENSDHSDFLLLRNMLVRTHMQDLKDVTGETHYENYRAQCIQNMTHMVVQQKKCRWVESGCRGPPCDSLMSQ